MTGRRKRQELFRGLGAETAAGAGGDENGGATHGCASVAASMHCELQLPARLRTRTASPHNLPKDGQVSFPHQIGSFARPRLTSAAASRIDTPVILAPMSGVTDLPFRRTAKSLGAGMVVSEMIASWAMIRENQKTLSMAQVDGAGGVSAVQLAGCDPAAMAEAARIAADKGADLIDINFGCPVKKVAVGQAAGLGADARRTAPPPRSWRPPSTPSACR